MSVLPLKRLKAVLESAAKNGIYVDGYLFEIEPETSLKLLDDRQVLKEAIEAVINERKFRADSPTLLRLKKALEIVNAGWPAD